MSSRTTVFSVSLFVMASCGGEGVDPDLERRAASGMARFTIYVSPSGNDNNGGLSPAAAVLTLQRAHDLLAEHRPNRDAAVLIESGTYRRQHVTWRYSHPRHHIHIAARNASKGKPVFDGLFVIYDRAAGHRPWVHTRQSFLAVLSGASRLHIKNLTIKNYVNGIGIGDGSTDVSVVGCVFRNIGSKWLNKRQFLRPDGLWPLPEAAEANYFEVDLPLAAYGVYAGNVDRLTLEQNLFETLLTYRVPAGLRVYCPKAFQKRWNNPYRSEQVEVVKCPRRGPLTLDAGAAAYMNWSILTHHHAVYLIGSSHVTIRHNRMVHVSGNPIKLMGVTDATIVNNTLRRSGSTSHVIARGDASRGRIASNVYSCSSLELPEFSWFRSYASTSAPASSFSFAANKRWASDPLCSKELDKMQYHCIGRAKGQSLSDYRWCTGNYYTNHGVNTASPGYKCRYGISNEHTAGWLRSLLRDGSKLQVMPFRSGGYCHTNFPGYYYLAPK